MKEDTSTVRECFHCYDRPVIICPAMHDRVKCSDELVLSCTSMLLDDLSRLFEVSSDGFFTWGDDGLKSEQIACFVPNFSRMRFSHWKLSDSYPKELKANVALIFSKGMGNFGFARFEFQAHVCQPACEQCLCLLHSRFRRVKNDQIIRISDESRLFFFPGECFCQKCFHSVQRYVH